MKLTPRGFIGDSIVAHEGKLSMHPADNGNWYDPDRYRKGLPQKRGRGKLVGSQYGVTAYTLARYLGRDNITAQDIKNVTFETAVDIGYKLYFAQPGFDKLVWNRVTASIFDMAWISGPGRAIKLLQEMVGAGVDGDLGPATARAYEAFIAKHGEAEAARRWCDVRIKFHTSLTDDIPNDPDKKFLKGWNNRSRSFLPGTKFWKNAE